MTTNFELKTGGSGPGTGKYKVDLPACNKNFSSQSLVESNCDACFMVEINMSFDAEDVKLKGKSKGMCLDLN